MSASKQPFRKALAENIEEEMLSVLWHILDYLDTNYPNSSATQAYFSVTQTIPASSKVTVTMTVESGWEARIYSIYADAAADCSYYWDLAGKEVVSNEVEFKPPVKLREYGLITLEITNNGTADQSIDIIVEGWGYRL